MAVIGTVMALHFSGLTVGLADDYRSLYSPCGRWLLAAAVLVGAVVGHLVKLPDDAFHLLLSAVAGMVIFSVIKEEIPPEQQSRLGSHRWHCRSNGAALDHPMTGGPHEVGPA